MEVQVLERKQCRLEEATKNLKMLGGVHLQDYEALIDSVTSEEINRTLERVFRGKPTYVVQGRALDGMPTLEDVKKYMA